MEVLSPSAKLWVENMGKHHFWKATLGLILLGQVAFASSDIQVGTLSEGACWYEFKETLRIASFNDKSSYSGTIAQIESEMETLIGAALSSSKADRPKIQMMDLALHCGGYGASLVAKVTTETNTLCLWTKFDKGQLSLRSIGSMADNGKNLNGICDGHKWGEFIMGVQSDDMMSELQLPKWRPIIKEVTRVTEKVVKVVLVKEYEFREQEVIDQLEESFGGKNFIRYIEFNDYRHPIGEFVHYK